MVKKGLLLTSVCIAFSLMGNIVNGVDSIQSQSETFADDVKSCRIYDYVDEVEFSKKGYQSRVLSEEELNTYVFSSSNGTNTMYMFEDNVKFKNDDGIIVEKNLSLQSVDAGYKMISNDFDLLFPKEISEGVKIEYNSMALNFIPNNTKYATAECNGRYVEYKNVFGDSTALKYSPLLSGVKEDIILYNNNGTNSFSFDVMTDNLVLEETSSGYCFVNEKLDCKFLIGNVIAYDSNGNFTLGEIKIRDKAQKNTYEISIYVPEKFLNNPETVYPVIVDPTITVSDSTHGTNAIQDAVIFSGKPDVNFGDMVYDRVGTPNASYGVGRTVVKLSGLTSLSSYRELCINQIVSASFHVKEASGTPTQYIKLHVLNSNTTWTESNVTWNNVGSYTTAINCGTNMSSNQWTSFDIMNVIRVWKSESYPQNAGFIMMSRNESEDKCFHSSETSDRPYVEITYTAGVSRNLFYSKYDPDKYNILKGQNNRYIINRINCYGYAFCNIYDGTADSIFPYKQQPGEFARTEDKYKTVNNVVINNPAQTMTNVVHNIELDAARLGFSITEYIPNSSTIAQYGTNSRMIALVTGNIDYHFYMQHNDGKWSHKPGESEVSNKSISTKVILTNSNIQAKANEGIYAGGQIKFFIITKNAIMDNPHGDFCCYPENRPCNHPQNTLYYREQAGDYFQTSKTMTLGTISGKFDYSEDHDVFCFIPQTTRVYNVSGSMTSTSDNIDCIVYDNSSTKLRGIEEIGNFSVSYKMIAGQRYFFDVYNKSNNVGFYTFSIT